MEVIKCRLCELCDQVDTGDLDPRVHEGFTIGKGKRMYWYIVWRPSGNATVYALNEGSTHLSARYVSGDAEITIHFVAPSESINT